MQKLFTTRIVVSRPLSSFLVILTGLNIASCASTDPSEGGLLGGVRGVLTGAYDERIDERQEKLRNVESQNQELLNEQSYLEGTVESRREAVSLIESKLGELDQRLVSLAQSAETIGAEKSKKDLQLRRLEDRNEKLKAQFVELKSQSQTSASESDYVEEYNRLVEQASALEKLIDIYSR